MGDQAERRAIMLLRKSMCLVMRRYNVIRTIHFNAKDERTNAVRNVSKSLYIVGKQRFETEKTATNVYEHFKEPTINLSDKINSSDRLKDFEDIHSVTVNFGSPEMSDQMSGSIYMHANMTEDKCSQCLRLAEDIPSYSITDLAMCLTYMTWWSSEASHSLALREVVSKLDVACVDRLASLHFSLQDQLRLAFQWQCLMFKHKAEFPEKMILELSSYVTQSSMPVLISFLLLLSSTELDSKTLPALHGQDAASKLQGALPLLSEGELLACYAGLRVLGGGLEGGVRETLHRKYGYRLQ